MNTRLFKIGLLGCGTVGRGLIDLITRNGDRIAEQTGVRLQVTRVLVRDTVRDRGIDRRLLTDRPGDVVRNGVDVVVEAMGGIEPARSLVVESMRRRKHVVTANKSLLAAHFDELQRLAAHARVHLGYEASTCGGAPVICAIRQALAGDRITGWMGIVNATSNFILTRMAERGESFDDAVRAARSRGFAEADPSNDVRGIDAAEKTAILCGTAFGVTAPVSAMTVRGIEDVHEDDLRFAASIGRVVKPLAWAQLGDDGRLSAAVSPVFLPRRHRLAQVEGRDNELVLTTEARGEVGLRAAGAGSWPTASAVLADLIDVASRPMPALTKAWQRTEALAAPAAAPHYLRFDMPLSPGGITLVVGEFAGRAIALKRIDVVVCPGRPNLRRVLALTGPCRPADLTSAVTALTGQPASFTAPFMVTP